ncbi:MAG: histidine kinase [Dermatophilaceae bacterium]
MRLSRPDPATVRTVLPRPARSCPPEARIALLTSTAVVVVIVAAHVRSALSGEEPSDPVRGLVVIPPVVACALFARVQLRLLRAANDPYWPWVVLGLGLVTAISTGQYWALALGAAAIILRLDRRHALAALGGCALVVLAGDRSDRAVGDAAVDLLVQVGVPALLLAALTRLTLDLQRPWWLHEQLLRHQVDLERDRVARDAHDLMGRTLVTASIRTERVLRLLDGGDPRVRARVNRLQQTLTAGERRVRTMTSQPVISTWDDELELARGLCMRLGIEFVVDEAARLPSHHRPLAGLVLRECVTIAIAVRTAVRVSARLEVAPDDAHVVHVVIDRELGPAPETPLRVIDAVDRIGGAVSVSDSDNAWALEARLPTTRPTWLVR